MRMGKRICCTAVAIATSLGLMPSTSRSLSAQGMELVPPDEYERIPLLSPATAPKQFGALPRETDLSAHLPRPGSQGQQGSCVAWAVAYGLKAYQESVELGRPPMRPEHEFSPAYVYNQVIANRRDTQCTGISIPEALELLRTRGAATMADFPYDPRTCERLPSQRVHAAAERFRIADWGRTSLDELSMKNHLAAGTPVVISMCGGDDFKAYRGGVFRGDGQEVMTVNASGNPSCSVYGHAMLAVGYDDGLGAYKILNSWGDRWGEAGYAWMSYGAFERQIKQAYVASDLPTWTAEERESELVRELAAAEARVAAAKARADSVTEAAEAAERRHRTRIARLEEQLRVDSTSASRLRTAANDDYPESATYDEFVKTGSPRLRGDRVTWALINPREEGTLASYGDVDVKGYLREYPCGRVRVNFGNEFSVSDSLVVLGLGHMRDTESPLIRMADDNAEGRNFRFSLRTGTCYALVAEGYDEDETGPYTLGFSGRASYNYQTYGLGGWGGWGGWTTSRPLRTRREE